MIPAAECVDVPDSGDRDPKKYEQYVMSKRLGSEVDYIVKGIDAEHDIVAASRKDAMEKKCKEFFPTVFEDVSEKQFYEALNVVKPSFIRT